MLLPLELTYIQCQEEQEQPVVPLEIQEIQETQQLLLQGLLEMVLVEEEEEMEEHIRLV